MLHNNSDLYAHFFSRWPISSASHKTTHKKETNTHRQSVRWTQSQESFKEELIVANYLVNTRFFTPSPWRVFVPKRVYVCVYTCVEQRTQKCNWIYIHIDLHVCIYVHLNLYVYIYVCIYIYLYIHIYLNKGADSTWNMAPSRSERVRRKSALTWNRTWTPKKCDSNRLQWFRMETARCASPGLLDAHCSLELPRVTLQTLGLWDWPRFSEK